MLIGVLREARPGETRVAGTPATVEQLRKLGYEVVMEAGAGEAASFPDGAYEAAGATVGNALAADIVFGVNAPSKEQLDGLRKGVTLISLLAPALNPGIAGPCAVRPRRTR
jgi:H+-translocating NAD(P) transhydrogenase subunit alpha